MADDSNHKVTEFTALTTPAAADLIHVIDLSEALPANQNKKVLISDFITTFRSTTEETAAGVIITDSNVLPYNMTRYGVDDTGATDDSTLVQDTLVNLAAQGIVGFYFPAGSYLFGDVYLPSNVDVYGDGDATLVTSPSNKNCFLNNGLHPGGYIDYTYFTLNDVTADDIVLTFDTASEAGNFTVNGLAFVRTVAEDSSGNNRTPHLVEVIKTLAVDVGAGTVTLEYAIKDAITNPEIAPPLATNHVNLTPNTPDRFAENTVLRDMKLVSADGTGWRLRTGYKCVMQNLTINSKHIIICNALTHCVVKHIRGEFTEKAIEVKTGGYNTVISDIDVRSVDATLSEPLVNIGEFARDITVDGFNIFAPQADFSSIDGMIAFGGEAGARHIVRNGKFTLGDIYSVVRIVHGNDPDNSDITVENITVRAKSIARPIYLNDGTGTRGTRFTIRNIDILDSLIANNVNGDSVAGYMLDQNNQDLTITDCRIPGSIDLDVTKTTPGMVFTNNRYTDFTGTNAVASQVLSEIYFKDNHRIGADSIYSTQVRTVAVENVTTTTPDTVHKSWTIPASQTWLEGDLFRFEITGGIAGTNDAKEINIIDNGNTLLDVTWLAAETGGFIITGLISIFNNTAYRTAFVANTEAIGAYAQNTEAIGSLDLSTNGRTFSITAWVANGSDTIAFQSIKMWPDLLGT